MSVFCGFHGNGRHFEILSNSEHFKFFTFFVVSMATAAILKCLSLTRLLPTFVLNWVFWRFQCQRQAFWNFKASKPFIHMPYNIFIKFHPMPSTLNFSCFFVVSMATTAILKIPKVDCTSTHSEVWISICSIMIYLETKVHPNRSIFVFWRPFCIQNGRHSKPKWSPLNIHFHWNLFIFEFFTIYFDFILAAILKIFKTKSTTLSDDLILCQVSKGFTVRSEFNIFCICSTLQSCHTLRTVDIPTKFHEVWW